MRRRGLAGRQDARHFAQSQARKPVSPRRAARALRTRLGLQGRGSHAIGRAWLDQLVQGDVGDLAAIAARENRSERSVRMILSLAFLAPVIVKAAIDGTLPGGHGLSTLTDLPMDWVEQRKVVGLDRD